MNNIFIKILSNFNLKRNVIEVAFSEFDTIIFLDTDIFLVNGVDFSLLEHLDEGVYIDKIFDIEQLRVIYGSLEYMEDYIGELNKLYNDKLYLVHEGLLVFKITNQEQKKNFIDKWKEIDWKTRPNQRLAYDLPGAMEGLIIYMALRLSNLRIELANGELKDMFALVAHFASRHKKLERTII